MPRYFFHMQTDTRTTDEEGVELENAVEARREAIRTCGEMKREAPEQFWGSRPWSVTATDGAGLVLWEIMMDGFAAPSTIGL